MPPAIKAYSKFANDGIIIPDINSKKFICLCNLALRYLFNTQNRKKIK